MKLRLLIAAFFICANCMAQESGCRVLKDGINKTYEGECKKKLASGAGTSTGEEGTYKGRFKKGLPDGQGRLDYVNGAHYEGEWRRGLRDGEGTFVHSADSVLDGFWKNDFYVGKYERPYKIITQRGGARYTFSKTNPHGSNVRLIFFRGGENNRSDVASLVLSNDSGIQMDNSNGFLEIQDAQFPFAGKLNATVSNRLRTSTYQIYMDYEIYEPGSWTIKISY